MAKHPTNQRYSPVHDTSATLPRIDAPVLQKALAAEPSDLTSDTVGSPLTLAQLRQELLQRVQTTGGRPSLSGASHRVKIPLSDGQWNELADIASKVRTDDFSPSAGQIASVLIALALRTLK